MSSTICLLAFGATHSSASNGRITVEKANDNNRNTESSFEDSTGESSSEASKADPTAASTAAGGAGAASTLTSTSDPNHHVPGNVAGVPLGISNSLNTPESLSSLSCYHTAQGDKRLAKHKHASDLDPTKSGEEPILKRPSPGDSLKVGARVTGGGLSVCCYGLRFRFFNYSIFFRLGLVSWNEREGDKKLNIIR